MVPNREAVIAQLKEAGIPTAVHYPRPIHAQPAYEQYAEGAGATPVSDDLAARVMSLPMHSGSGRSHPGQDRRRVAPGPELISSCRRRY